jgi:hypothetical protein
MVVVGDKRGIMHIYEFMSALKTFVANRISETNFISNIGQSKPKFK